MVLQSRVFFAASMVIGAMEAGLADLSSTASLELLLGTILIS